MHTELVFCYWLLLVYWMVEFWLKGVVFAQQCSTFPTPTQETTSQQMAVELLNERPTCVNGPEKCVGVFAFMHVCGVGWGCYMAFRRQVRNLRETVLCWPCTSAKYICCAKLFGDVRHDDTNGEMESVDTLEATVDVEVSNMAGVLTGVLFSLLPPQQKGDGLQLHGCVWCCHRSGHYRHIKHWLRGQTLSSRAKGEICCSTILCASGSASDTRGVASYLPSPCRHSGTSESGSTGSGCVSSCPQDSSYWPDTHTWRFSARCARERINRHTDNKPPNTINNLIFDLFNSICVFSSPSKNESRSSQVRF